MLAKSVCFLCFASWSGRAGGWLGSFTAPEQLTTEPVTVLWLLPLAASIAVVYKATKVASIKPLEFIKEVVILFISIVGFVVISALALLIFARLFV